MCVLSTPFLPDLDLYSVNYLHYGAPKTWYCVAPGMKERFERAAEGLAPELFRECASFLRHKELLLSPTLLKSLGVPFTRITQARERGGCVETLNRIERQPRSFGFLINQSSS